MSFCVSDIFTLVPQNNVTLLAGEEGLCRIITSIGIADAFETHYRNLYSKEPFLQDKIMVSCLLPNWTTETQCDCLHFLQNAGASGLILIPLPDHPQGFEEPFLRTADELNIPVILMVPERQKWSYSEVIYLIMKGILNKDKPSYKLSYAALMELANLPAGQEREYAMLEILCKNARLSVALLDGGFSPKYQVSYNKDGNEVFTSELLTAAREAKKGIYEQRNKQRAFFSNQRVFLAKSQIKYLLIVSDSGPIDPEQQSWVSDVVSFFFAAWDGSKSGEDSLAEAIMQNNQVEAQTLAKSLHVNLKQLKIAYMYFPGKNLSQREMAAHFLKIEQYFYQLSFKPIMTISGQAIVVFLEAPSYPIDFSDFTRVFQGVMEQFNNDFFLVAHMQEDIVNVDFCMITENIYYARKVYPHKRVYTLQEIQFVHSCAEDLRCGGEAFNNNIELIRLQTKGQVMTDELWNTLAVYLLDADGKNEQAAGYLFIHISTLKYRLKRIQECLGHSIHKMPEVYNLYKALAIMRLTA